MRDVLMVTRLDRPARSTRDLLKILDAVDKAGAAVKSRYLLNDTKLPRRTLNDSRDQSLVDARDRRFQSAPCFCQFIRLWRLVLLLLLSGRDSHSVSQ